MPLWSRDGRRIVFSAFHNGVLDLYQKSASGADAGTLLLQSAQNKAAYTWSPDGRFLVYGTRHPVTGMDLWVLPMGGQGKPFPFLTSRFDERWAQISHDGKWIAYQSNETGMNEIYVRAFPGPGGQWSVSTSGGITPLWRADGKELYFIAPNGTLMAAPMTVRGGALQPGPPTALFRTQIVYRGVSPIGAGRQYDVAPDGRFLLNVSTADASSSAITILVNWHDR